MNRRIANNILFYLILIAAAIVFLLPVYLMVLTGFKPFNEVDLKTMWSLPTTGLHIDNFIAGFQQLAPNLLNSLEMVIPEALLSSLLGSINGYLLSKWKFRGSNLLFTFNPVWDVYSVPKHLNSACKIHAVSQAVWGHSWIGLGACYLWHSYYNVNFPKLLCRDRN